MSSSHDTHSEFSDIESPDKREMLNEKCRRRLESRRKKGNTSNDHPSPEVERKVVATLTSSNKNERDNEIERSQQTSREWFEKYQSEKKFRKQVEKELAREKRYATDLEKDNQRCRSELEKPNQSNLTPAKRLALDTQVHRVKSLKRKNNELEEQISKIKKECQDKENDMMRENEENESLLESLIEAAESCTCRKLYKIVVSN